MVAYSKDEKDQESRKHHGNGKYQREKERERERGKLELLPWNFRKFRFLLSYSDKEQFDTIKTLQNAV